MNKTQKAMNLALEALEETRNALAWFYDSYPQDVTKKGNELLPHVETVLAAIREALAEQPAQQQEPLSRVDVACDIKTLCVNGDLPDSFEEVAEWVAAGSMPEQQEPVSGVVIREGLPALLQDRNIKPTDQRLYTSPQPAQQEPVAWRWTESNGQHWFDWRTDWTHHDRANAMGFAIEYAYTSPQPAQQQEPVARVIDDGTSEGSTEWIPFANRMEPLETGDLLYTFPPASKPWVGLTDEEIEDAWPFVWRKHESVRHFAIYHAIEAKLREKNA